VVSGREPRIRKKQRDSARFSCNSVHPIHSTLFTNHNNYKQLPLPGIRAPIGPLALVLGMSKSFPFLLHAKLHSTSPKTPKSPLQSTLASTLNCSPAKVKLGKKKVLVSFLPKFERVTTQ